MMLGGGRGPVQGAMCDQGRSSERQGPRGILDQCLLSS